MPEIKIVVTHADAREERTVTTGTKAWELYADRPEVIAARNTANVTVPTAAGSR